MVSLAAPCRKLKAKCNNYRIIKKCETGENIKY